MSSFGDLNRVNTNIQSLNAQFSLNKINRDLAQNQLMLATGLRINRAEDDAAGFSMAMTFKARTGGLTEALGNVGDAKGMLNVAEANFDAIFDNLLEMKALATRAGTDSMGEKERADLGAQIAALGQDINEISDQTVYQDKQLLNGDPLTGDAAQTFNFLVGEREQDLVTVSLDRVDMNELFRGSSALQNVSSTTVSNFGLTAGQSVSHIAIKVGSTMSSEKHIIKLVEDATATGGYWSQTEIGATAGAAGAAILGGSGEEFLDTLVAQIDAKNIDGVWGEKVEDVAEARGEWTFNIATAFASVSSDFTIANVDIGVTSGAASVGGAVISVDDDAIDQVGTIVDILNANGTFSGQYTAIDGGDGTFTIRENEGEATGVEITFATGGVDTADTAAMSYTTDTASVQSEWSFVLHNTNTEEVSFSLLHTTTESATSEYDQVGATNLSVAAAEDPNNRLEFDQRGSGTDGVWTAADFRSFIADVDAAIVEMTNRVNDVGIAQSSLTKREETLSQSISSNFSAISRIMDTDFAKVQSDSIRLQILQQTATVSLAQANFGPQSVLGFLG